MAAYIAEIVMNRVLKEPCIRVSLFFFGNCGNKMEATVETRASRPEKH